MSRETVDPVYTKKEFAPGDDSVTITHPAYAQISASRISGQTCLYGSDFRHNHYVRIRIASSYLRRNVSSDWPHASIAPFVEVDMSEAQWAKFISSMNIGQGTQCTLVSRDGERVPGIPDPVDRSAQFSGEVAENMRSAMEQLAILRTDIQSSKLSAKAAEPLLSRLNKITQEIGVNTTFVANQFDKHVEKTVEKAKIEVNAYAVNTINRLGLDALGVSAPLTLGNDHD